MKLQYKQQKFQEDAAKSVCDVFIGQPYNSTQFLSQIVSQDVDGVYSIGYGNYPIIPELLHNGLLHNIQSVQKQYGLEVSTDIMSSPSCNINLTIEMETGVGKTYTYIKTMYELNKRYGWSKFIIVVPSIAIREGVFSTFKSTSLHFYSEYGKSINAFIYDSSNLTEIGRFALTQSDIDVMIINSQAFNARGKDARRIYMELDEFRSYKPIDVIAQTNPILIIDEPQSVEGKQTKDNLKNFNPLMVLRYSATHKKDCIYNMVYRLDALDAYNLKLVKKIAVKGIEKCGNNASSGYIYLSSINVSKTDPSATIEMDVKTKTGTKRVFKTVSEGFNLYEHSGCLEEYKGICVQSIRADYDTVEFSNGLVLSVSQISNHSEEIDYRRIQIRETIKSHFEKESILYSKGIKVLSLFFIDEVSKYKQYDDNNNPVNGEYAKIFEKEYSDFLESIKFNDELCITDEYKDYLDKISVNRTHAGYFSIDKKKGTIKNSDEKDEGKISNDVDAYDLIMKDKETLLDLDPNKSPVRFIFSHSALREGWDNPNVFQICTLKNTEGTEIRRRQEVGRGLRLCVNQKGERQDVGVLGKDQVHEINRLTVIASESYEDYASGLQAEIASSISSRPVKVTVALFKGIPVSLPDGTSTTIDDDTASNIYFDLRQNEYVDKTNHLTDAFSHDSANNTFKLTDDDLKQYTGAVKKVLDSVFNGNSLIPENDRKNNIVAKANEKNLDRDEFKALWSKINSKSMYLVDFDSNELINKSVQSINKDLFVNNVTYLIRTGEMDKIESKNSLQKGSDFYENRNSASIQNVKQEFPDHLKFDLVGKIVENTGLTRKDIVSILTKIEPEKFDLYKQNPEDFIIKASNIINIEKSVSVVEHISYDLLNETYSTDIFTNASIRGRLDQNAMAAEKHVLTHVIYDSAIEKKFAEELEKYVDVIVYAKLPRDFYISTPLGKYNPDWAVAFSLNNQHHVYFVAETKGSNFTAELRKTEQAKIACAKKHFEKICKKINSRDVVYDVVSDFGTLLDKVKYFQKI